MGKATSSSSSSSSASLLEIAGLRVLGVFEFVDERHVFVETVRDYDACHGCGQRAVSGSRHFTRVRDLPGGPKATRLLWHVGCTHAAKELLRSVFAAGESYAARTALGRFYDWAATVQIPEVTRLANTIDRWSDEVLAYYHTGRASAGPVEAVNGEIGAVDGAARGFPKFHHYRTPMLLKTATSWQTPPTPRIRGRGGQSDPASPAFIV